jgi:hypothetical protein
MNSTAQTPTETAAKTSAVVLDKSFSSPVSETYGTIDIRVVVLKRRIQQSVPEFTPPVDAEEGEIFLSDTSKSPLAGYLEDPKRGKECIVFLVNGQRQEAWDNAFIQRDLGFKYLRNRTMIIVTLDGLKPEALADIMQGSREHFYPGTVHGAIVGRLTATLRKDPDLEELEAEAERQISELRSGDVAVKNALDQLIQDHHTHGDHAYEGAGEKGVADDESGFGENRGQEVVRDPKSNAGVPTEGPYLSSDHVSSKIRLVPGEQFTVKIGTTPSEAFVGLTDVGIAVLPETPGLQIEQQRIPNSIKVQLTFLEPEDFDDDAYPIDATFRVVARLDGRPEPRLLEKKIVIARPKVRTKRPPAVLRPVPSFLKVTSRQPVRLVRGSADTHVRLRWDGQDALATGAPPLWVFGATCTTEPTLGPMTFSTPQDGRFELLIPTPATLSPGMHLDFDVKVVGPQGATLRASFSGEVVDPAPPPSPLKSKANIPGAGAQRRPPYKLVYIDEDKFDSVGLWQDDRPWTTHDAGCF